LAAAAGGLAAEAEEQVEIKILIEVEVVGQKEL
jgi:hypothetical protein